MMIVLNNLVVSSKKIEEVDRRRDWKDKYIYTVDVVSWRDVVCSENVKIYVVRYEILLTQIQIWIFCKLLSRDWTSVVDNKSLNYDDVAKMFPPSNRMPPLLKPYNSICKLPL